MTYRQDLDYLPTREGMRTPYKSRHSAARFTTRTAPARYRHAPEMGR